MAAPCDRAFGIGATGSRIPGRSMDVGWVARILLWACRHSGAR